MSIPCTGKDEGVAHLILGLRIMDQNNKPIKGSPIKLRLRKRCFKFGEQCLHISEYDRKHYFVNFE